MNLLLNFSTKKKKLCLKFYELKKKSNMIHSKFHRVLNIDNDLNCFALAAIY